MGFPTKNPDGTPFQEENEYIKSLEAEVETLREQVRELFDWKIAMSKIIKDNTDRERDELINRRLARITNQFKDQE